MYCPELKQPGFIYLLPEHNLEAIWQIYKPMNLLFSVPEQSTNAPTWAIIRDLARLTWSKHLNVRIIWKIKITAHPAKNDIVSDWKYQVSKHCCLLATVSHHHNELTPYSPLTGKARCRDEQNWHCTNWSYVLMQANPVIVPPQSAITIFSWYSIQ